MNELVAVVITLLSVLTLIGQVLAIVLLLLFFVPAKKGKIATIKTLITQNAITLIFVFASVATIGSLFLSEVAVFVPCKMCWLQRIFMYPIAVISFIALIKNDKGSIRYIFPLSIIGLGFALYHNFMQWFPEALECSEEVAKCSTIQFAEFGYITIPVMAATAFALIIISSVYLLKKN